MKYDYALLDSGNFRKLEKVGPYLLIRPCLQAIWSPSQEKEWQKAHFEFKRQKDGSTLWSSLEKGKTKPTSWPIHLGHFQKTLVKLTDFGHLGFFPEHHVHTKFLEEVVSKQKSKKDFRVLNLFAYTGALSLFLANLGVQVTHLDASKKSIDWGKENLELSKIDTNFIRWIADDVVKFVQREERRNSLYDGVILDPPTFGRGTKGEVWKIEESLPLLMKDLMKLLKKDFSFIILSSHTPGHTPLALKNLLSDYVQDKKNIEAFELTVTEELSGRLLPSGSCAIYKKR